LTFDINDRPATAHDLILSCLPALDMINFSRTNKTYKRAVDSFMQRAFRINHVLERYFTPAEIATFRYLQSRSQLIISGSTAVQFFERSIYLNSDLDIYVEDGYKNVIALWLVSIGYTYRRREGQPTLEVIEDWKEFLNLDVLPFSPVFEPNSTDYMGQGIEDVYNFVRGDPEVKIQLMTATGSPLEIVLNYHSSENFSIHFSCLYLLLADLCYPQRA